VQCFNSTLNFDKILCFKFKCDDGKREKFSLIDAYFEKNKRKKVVKMKFVNCLNGLLCFFLVTVLMVDRFVDGKSESFGIHFFKALISGKTKRKYHKTVL
jgi:hypothetical protein